jgi:FkbM family methyltransferase
MNDFKQKKVTVRNVSFNLMTYTRSLELCAKMNYETENLDFIDEINPNDVLYDLGACEGRFTIYAASKGIRVFSFEPEQKNFTVLNQNIKLNDNVSNLITAINAGVGAHNGKAKLNIGQPWEGGHQKVIEISTTRKDLGFTFIDSQEVNILSLDSVAGKDLPAPNYLKVDVDGSEIPFLEGAKSTLENTNLLGIIIELNILDVNFKNIINNLSAFGFKEKKRYSIPNEASLYNITFYR